MTVCTQSFNIVKKDTIQLDLDNPNENPFGVFAFRTKHCKTSPTSDLQLDTVDLYLFVFDYIEYVRHEGNLYQVSIEPGGGSLKVYLPSQPAWLQMVQTIKAVHKQATKKNTDERTQEAHLFTANDNRVPNKINVVELKIKLPNGIKVNNEHFNSKVDAKDTVSLTPNIDVLKLKHVYVNPSTSNNDTFEQQMNAVSFKMPIIGSEKSTGDAAATANAPIDALAALQGMQSLQI